MEMKMDGFYERHTGTYSEALKDAETAQQAYADAATAVEAAREALANMSEDDDPLAIMQAMMNLLGCEDNAFIAAAISDIADQTVEHHSN